MKKKVLLIGRWGKTHALAKAIVESGNADLYSYMDKPNAGIVPLAKEYKIGDLKDSEKIIDYALEKEIDLAIVVPHMTLKLDLTNDMIDKGIRCVGPTKQCSKLETDKGFLREILNEVAPDVSPSYQVFTSEQETIDHIRGLNHDFAVKPAGVTEGDGVKVIGIQLKNVDEAVEYVREIFAKNIGKIPRVIIEEKLTGREFTIQAFVDGKTMAGMPATRDYKLLKEGERGLNTPGMGSISFSDHLLPFLNQKQYDESLGIMQKVVDHLQEHYNAEYKGFLSGQFIMTEEGIKVIEFNVRPGDSEILNITPILKTNFVDICEAIVDGSLAEMDIIYEDKATVCKYVVGEGFPHPKGNLKMEIDEQAIAKAGGHLFYSCFAVKENEFAPSPRGVAVTALGDSLEEAWKNCEELITNNIHGENIWHRTDIGSKELLEIYEERFGNGENIKSRQAGIQ